MNAFRPLTKIPDYSAAKAYDGTPCVAYIGPNGTGHFVKMVHNGIEYGDMVENVSDTKITGSQKCW